MTTDSIGFEVTFDGYLGLLDTFKHLGDQSAAKIAAAGTRAWLGTVRTGMRSEVTHRSVKQAINTRFRRKKRIGTIDAKVGAGVGRRKKGRPQHSKSGGSGMSNYNAHWYFLGTKRRQHKSGKSTGVMPTNDGVNRGARKSLAKANANMAKKVETTLDTEVAKLRAKAQARSLKFAQQRSRVRS